MNDAQDSQIISLQAFRDTRRVRPPSSPTVVAVTGTNGKTSVVTFVRQIWEHMGFKAASLGTLGVEPALVEGAPRKLPRPCQTQPRQSGECGEQRVDHGGPAMHVKLRAVLPCKARRTREPKRQAPIDLAPRPVDEPAQHGGSGGRPGRPGQGVQRGPRVRAGRADDRDPRATGRAGESENRVVHGRAMGLSTPTRRRRPES